MKKLIQILSFIFLGIPGALVFVFASIALVGKVFDPRAVLPDSHTLLLTCIIGIVATLIGIGKFKQWLYSFVFFAFPLSFWIWILINPIMFDGLFSMLVFVGLSVFGSLKAVRYYYGEQQNEIL